MTSVSMELEKIIASKIICKNNKFNLENEKIHQKKSPTVCFLIVLSTLIRLLGFENCS